MGYERPYQWYLSCDFCKGTYRIVQFSQEELDRFREVAKQNILFQFRPFPPDFAESTIQGFMEQKVEEQGWYLIGEAAACPDCKGKP